MGDPWVAGWLAINTTKTWPAPDAMVTTHAASTQKMGYIPFCAHGSGME